MTGLETYANCGMWSNGHLSQARVQHFSLPIPPLKCTNRLLPLQIKRLVLTRSSSSISSISSMKPDGKLMGLAVLLKSFRWNPAPSETGWRNWGLSDSSRAVSFLPYCSSLSAFIKNTFNISPTSSLLPLTLGLQSFFYQPNMAKLTKYGEQLDFSRFPITTTRKHNILK